MEACQRLQSTTQQPVSPCQSLCPSIYCLVRAVVRGVYCMTLHRFMRIARCACVTSLRHLSQRLVGTEQINFSFLSNPMAIRNNPHLGHTPLLWLPTSISYHPRTAPGEVFAQAPSASSAQLDDAVTAARNALTGWTLIGEGARKKYMMKVAAELMKPEIFLLLGKVLCMEQGKPLASAVGEVLGAAKWIQATNTYSVPPPETVLEDKKMKVVRYEGSKRTSAVGLVQQCSSAAVQ